MKGLELRSSRRLGSEVTFVGFGALEIGRNWGMGKDTERPCEEGAGDVLTTVLGAGINLIDTASAYHRSEERIGKFLSGRRGEFFLASKCGEHNKDDGTYYDFSYKAVKNSIDNSLMLLKTDVIDLMQIHFGPNAAKVIERGETLAAMKDAAKEGKIRLLGASIDGDLALKCIESGDFDVMQMKYNLMDRSNEKNIALAAEKGIAVFIRQALGNGLFTPRVFESALVNPFKKAKAKKILKLVDNDTDKYMAIALNFLYRNENITSVLLGTKKASHVRKNLDLLDIEISDELMNNVLKIVR